jgi:hypothetical protein
MTGFGRPRLRPSVGAVIAAGGLVALGWWGSTALRGTGSPPAFSSKGAQIALAAASPATVNPSPAPRKVETTAAATLYTARVRSAAHVLEALAAHLGGYVAAFDEMGTGRHATATLTVAVPAPRLVTFLNGLSRSGRVTALSQHGLDVTARWTNLTWQLAALTSEAAAYRRLYGRAASIRDMLEIQQALSLVDARITADRQLERTLAEAVTFATVTVTVLPMPGSRPPVDPVAVVEASLATMLAVARTIATALLWALPWAVLAGIASVPLWRRRRSAVRP